MSVTRQNLSKVQEGKFSHREILNKLNFKKDLQATADKYLDSSIEQLGNSLFNLIYSEINSDILEFFMIGLKKITSDIQILMMNGINPLRSCVTVKDSNKLAILLNYGANPNREFIKKVEDRAFKFIDTPSLLVAMRHFSKDSIRLLVLFGASWEKIDVEKLSKDDRSWYLTMPEANFEFYRNVLSDINTLRLTDAKAQEAERKSNFLLKDDSSNFQFKNDAFSYYNQLGNIYIKFSGYCETECKDDISRYTLPIFYMRKALGPYERALYCIEKYIESNKLSVEEAISLGNMLKIFNLKVVGNCSLLRFSSCHAEKFIPFYNKYIKLEKYITQILKENEVKDSLREEELEEKDCSAMLLSSNNSLRQRLISSKTKNYSEDESPSDNERLSRSLSP